MYQFTEVPGRKVADIKLYALSTCPWCHKTKEFLNENDIEYEYVDVDTLDQQDEMEAAKDLMKYNPSPAFPTLIINDSKVIVGYQPAELEQLIA